MYVFKADFGRESFWSNLRDLDLDYRLNRVKDTGQNLPGTKDGFWGKFAWKKVFAPLFLIKKVFAPLIISEKKVFAPYSMWSIFSRGKYL